MQMESTNIINNNTVSIDNLISNDTWMTVLSYLKDIDSIPVKPDQFIAIMKMSFVTKSLRNIIITNNFWILYNSNEYEFSKYNIYDCNSNFCSILYKINKLEAGSMINLNKQIYNNRTNIFGTKREYGYIKDVKHDISNMEIIPSTPLFDILITDNSIKIQGIWDVY